MIKYLVSTLRDDIGHIDNLEVEANTPEEALEIGSLHFGTHKLELRILTKVFDPKDSIGEFLCRRLNTTPNFAQGFCCKEFQESFESKLIQGNDPDYSINKVVSISYCPFCGTRFIPIGPSDEEFYDNPEDI